MHGTSRARKWSKRRSGLLSGGSSAKQASACSYCGGMAVGNTARLLFGLAWLPMLAIGTESQSSMVAKEQRHKHHHSHHRHNKRHWVQSAPDRPIEKFPLAGQLTHYSSTVRALL